MPRAKHDPVQDQMKQLAWAQEDLDRAIERANASRKQRQTEAALEYDRQAAEARRRIVRYSGVLERV